MATESCSISLQAVKGSCDYSNLFRNNFMQVLLLSNLSPEDQPAGSSLPCTPRPTLPDITCQGIGQVDSGGPSPAGPSSPPGHSHQPPLSSNQGLFCPRLF